MGLAGTDVAHHRRFVGAAETIAVQSAALNDDITQHARPGVAYTAGHCFLVEGSGPRLHTARRRLVLAQNWPSVTPAWHVASVVDLVRRQRARATGRRVMHGLATTAS